MTDRPKIFTEGQILAIEAADARKWSAVRKWILREAVSVAVIALLAWWAYLTSDRFLQKGQRPLWETHQTEIIVTSIVMIILTIIAHAIFYRWLFRTA